MTANCHNERSEVSKKRGVLVILLDISPMAQYDSKSVDSSASPQNDSKSLIE